MAYADEDFVEVTAYFISREPNHIVIAVDDALTDRHNIPIRALGEDDKDYLDYLDEGDEHTFNIIESIAHQKGLI